MKNLIHYLWLLISCLTLSTATGQHSHYNIEDYPSFASIERFLQEDQLDSVFILSAAQLQKNESPKLNGITYYYKGLAEQALGRNELAGQSLDKAISLFQIDDYSKGLALAYTKRGEVYSLLMEYEDASTLYNLAIPYATKQALYPVLADIYQKKAYNYNALRSYTAAIEELKRALQYALEADEDLQTSNIVNQISTNYHSLGELDSAIHYFQLGIRIKKELVDPNGLISDYSALGNLYRERGAYQDAQFNLMQALNIAEEENDSFSITTIYTELGDIYAVQKIWDVSEDYYSKAIIMARLKNSRFMEASCLKKLGSIALAQNEVSTAIEYYESSLKLFTALKNKVNIAQILIDLSSLYKTGSQLEKAKYLLQESLKTSLQSQDSMSVWSTKLAIAKVEVKLGNIRQGISYGEECLNAYEKIGDKENIARVSLLLSQAHARIGDYKKAYLFNQDYSIIKDSLQSIEQAEAVKKYDLLITTQKKDEEIAEQQQLLQDQEVTLLRKNNQLLLLAGGIGLLALVAVLLFFIYYKNKQINQQRIHVLLKERETQRLKAIIEGEEKERKRFARELHDGLGAVLATVKMQISSISHKFPSVHNSETYLKAETLIDDACRTVREVSHDLMPYVLEQQGLLPAIEDMCQNLSSHTSIEIDFITFGDEGPLSDVIKITVYRIVQELLKNISKHAQATEVIVQLNIENGELILVVEDNGKGFDTSQINKGIGIGNIQSRAEYLNGTLEIESVIGQGTTFTVQLPTSQ